MKKTIGILGGMGPEATAYMYELIIENTRAEKDQDHIRVIVYSNPQIPPRTEALLNKGQSPTPLLVEGVKILKKAGADLIIMPCVTAHCFYPEVASQVKFRFLSLIEESLKWTKKNMPGLKKAGLISSTGTLKSGIFHDAFSEAGIEVICPSDEEQRQVMEAIDGKQGIKAGFYSGLSKEIIVHTAMSLIRRGAGAVIAGCTEVPLVLKPADIQSPLIEPMKITALAGIKEAGYEITAQQG